MKPDSLIFKQVLQGGIDRLEAVSSVREGRNDLAEGRFALVGG